MIESILPVEKDLLLSSVFLCRFDFEVDSGEGIWFNESIFDLGGKIALLVQGQRRVEIERFEAQVDPLIELKN